MKLFYTRLFEPAAPSTQDAGAPPATIASTPDGSFTKGADGNMTFNEGGLPAGVTAPLSAPAPSGSDKTTIVKPDTSTQPPAKPASNDLDMFEAAKSGVKLPDAVVAKPLSTPPPEKIVPATKDAAAPPATKAEPAMADGKQPFKFDPFKGKQAPAPNAEPTATKPTANAPINQPRDYSGLEPQEQEIFKKMGNEAFDMLKPIYLQHKQAKTNPPQAQQLNVLEHQEAYILTPEYKQAVNYYERANYESSHWQQQLAKLRAGEKWNDIAMNQQGQYTDGPAYDATPQAEAHIIANLTKTSQIASQAQNTIQQVSQQFGNYYKQSVQAIREAEAKFFPFYENVDNPHKEQLQAILAAIPAPLRNTPLAPMLAKAGSAYKETLRQLEEAHEKIALLEGKHQEQTLVQGNQRSMGANGGSQGGARKGVAQDNLIDAFELAKV